MDIWLIIPISLSICVIVKLLLTRFTTKHITTKNITTHHHGKKLPPGPSTIPIIGALSWLIKPVSDIESTLRNLHEKYGPIIDIRAGKNPNIFIAGHTLAHQALIQNGAVLADRMPVTPTVAIITSNQRNISTSFYGPQWRLLRRNLTAEILHPSRIKSFSHARKWAVFDILINGLKTESLSKSKSKPVPIRVIDHVRYTLFCLATLICFGEKLEEKKIEEIRDAQRGVLLNYSFGKFAVLDFWPSFLGKILFRKRWEDLLKLRKDQENVLLPLIRSRKKKKEDKFFKNDMNKEDKDECIDIVPYADTLLDLQLPDENRYLEEDELVTLCSEFIDAGTDTSTAALQWIMANLVKYPHIQEKLFIEIKGVIGENGDQEVKEEDLQVMPYLKAVILEALRRHPPGHFLLAHRATEDVVLGDFLVPKNSSVNFMVADMGWDPKVWNDPMEFRPERFLEGGGERFDVDITGSSEVKMMPFGAGRRICPGHVLGTLQLEYIVANLVWNFEWVAVGEVNLVEKQEASVVMKDPLHAYIFPRLKTTNNCVG